MLGDDNLRLAAERVGWYGIERYRKGRAPWPCGVGGAGETPNLMLGVVAGPAGYAAQVLIDPTRFASNAAISASCC